MKRDVAMKKGGKIPPQLKKFVMAKKKKIKKVVKALKKASKAHAGQAKVLKGVLHGGSKSRNGKKA